MFYTGKGDDGITSDLKGVRHSKNSIKKEALGTLDELNSFLGLAKVKAKSSGLFFKEEYLWQIIYQAQKDLFIIQAELAGSEKSVTKKKVDDMEKLIDQIEKSLPDLKSFSIPGTNELNALLHVARTITRRTERKIVAYCESGESLGETSRQYMNRLSSLMYALARLGNHLSGIKEESPDYK